MMIPRATYRLQFHRAFRLADALALVPYFEELGVSHIYASPLFKAAPLSQHGYDVCDFNQLNPELGTEADLARLADALHARNMGLILDIVPNHMGTALPANTWWWDVLAHGKNSRFATHFDIDWEPPDRPLRGKVLVPILGRDYQEALRAGELQVRLENGNRVLDYQGYCLPIAPETAAKLPTDPAGLAAINCNLAALDQLLQRQHYQLASYEQGDARLNYRRFFTVSSLAGIREEEESTFAATHALLRRWLEQGLVDGLRVDHPDGLRNPEEYLRRLRSLAPNAWIVVEKILGPDEQLPAAWPVQGTTGYEFLNQVNGLCLQRNAEQPLTDFYTAFSGETSDYTALLLEKKLRVLKTMLTAEWSRLSGLLAGLAVEQPAGKHCSHTDLREALAEVAACFPLYRSYLTGLDAPGAADVEAIEFAVHLACERRQDLPAESFALMRGLLLHPQRRARARDFILRFQQLTGAVMAKGAEDTAFYCYNRLVAQNEVGGNPRNFGCGTGDFHRLQQRRKAHWPYSQLATATHDTKRGEDMRARLNVLSEIPELWAESVRRWSAMNSPHRKDGYPDRNAEYLLYQTLAGAWPVSVERAQAYMEKAAREAKQHTGWIRRDERYEAALKSFISGVLANHEFTEALSAFVRRISEAAVVNSLAQTLLKLTAPGVPDIYQGCELWDFSLVDPDNRRPVDFTLRRSLLAEVGRLSVSEAWRRRSEGVPKMWVIQKTLRLRASLLGFPDLDYEPVYAQGLCREHVTAFSRGGIVLPVVPRFCLNLNQDWQDTTLELPTGKWRDEFSGAGFQGVTKLCELLREFPVALLVQKEPE